jgi:hypothetical protein
MLLAPVAVSVRAPLRNPVRTSGASRQGGDIGLSTG